MRPPYRMSCARCQFRGEHSKTVSTNWCAVRHMKKLRRISIEHVRRLLCETDLSRAEIARAPVLAITTYLSQTLATTRGTVRAAG